jgi:macrolide transport system ATP-binding/permease protein
MNDLRFALRQLLKSPGFTFVAVLSMALGIGANTSLFTVLYALVWRPLPVSDPSSVVNLHQSFAGPSDRQAIGGLNRVSYPEYLNYRDRTKTLSGLLAFEDGSFTFGDTKTSRASAVMATGNYFSVLGATPALGRLWSAAECDVPGASPVAVLSHSFWQRQFGGDTGVVGRTVFLNRRSLTVIGVAAPGFQGTDVQAPDLWVPLLLRTQLVPEEPTRLTARDISFLRIEGRLKPGVSLAEARQELGTIALQSDADAAITAFAKRKTQVEVKTAAYFNSPEEMRQGLPIVAVIMVAVGLILVVVCANVSNLLLARASVRRREIGVRLALGAGRARLIRQLLTESLVLAGIAGAIGLGLAYWMPQLLFLALPAEGKPVLDLTPNLTILAYCLGVSFVAALCVGLVPALHATRLDLASLLSAQGALLGQRIGGARLRSVLVVTQVAVSLVLLVSAGLLVRGMRRAMSTDLGFDRKNLFIVSIDPEASGYDANRVHAFYADLQERLRGVAGVKSTGLAVESPFYGTSSTSIHLEQGAPAGTQNLMANLNIVTPGYFETLGIVMVQGRHFTAADASRGKSIAVISQAMASRCWPGESAVGKHFFAAGPDPLEVIGVARDVSTVMPGVMDGPFFYQAAYTAQESGNELVVRADAAHPVSAQTLRDLAQSLDRGATVAVKTLEDNVARRVLPARLASTAAGALGLLALGLVALGIYGVMAYVVSQRTREIGVRIALGAESWVIQRQMIGEGTRTVAIGIVLGVLLAALAGRVLRGAIFGLGPLDPVTFVGVPLLLLTISVLACWFPSRHAARVDPMEALRHE